MPKITCPKIMATTAPATTMLMLVDTTKHQTFSTISKLKLPIHTSVFSNRNLNPPRTFVVPKALQTSGTSSRKQRRPQNVQGDFFVDHTCIDCDVCRWMAPDTFTRVDDMSAVYKQPSGEEDRLRALQITECRRVLKWSYVYAFYMSEEENGKKKFFEFWQGEAEAALERLHHCAKKDLEDYLNGVGGENHNIKVKVITLTKATKTCFATLVRALENGLEDAEGSSGCKRQHEKLGAVGASTSTTYDDDGWDCQHCTYFNTNNDAKDCEICALPRR